MNAFKLFMFSILLLTGFSVSAQKIKGPVLGEYSVWFNPINHDSIDSVKNLFPVRIVEPIILSEYNSSQSLKLKWYRRFIITDDRPITAIGINTDNPTIYGTYCVKNDTLILKYRYTIQHFNKLARKRRKKIKFKQKERSAPVKRFVRKAKNEFKISQYSYWKRQ